MDKRESGGWPEPESEKALHYGKALEERQKKAEALVAGWLEHRRNLKDLLQRAKNVGDTRLELQFEEQIRTADKNIVEVLQLLGMAISEIARDQNVRDVLEMAIKDVKERGENGK
jgi:hypothetical protein